MKKLRYWVKCIKIVWKARGERNCRQKLRRLGREFIRAAQELDIGL